MGVTSSKLVFLWRSLLFTVCFGFAGLPAMGMSQDEVQFFWSHSIKMKTGHFSFKYHLLLKWLVWRSLESLTDDCEKVERTSLESTQVMESLESFFDWEGFFEPRLLAISLFFSNISRCNRFNKICIKDNRKIAVSMFRSKSPFSFNLFF